MSCCRPGREVCRAGLASQLPRPRPVGPSIVAFFSTTCSVCPKSAPAFVQYMRAHSRLVPMDDLSAALWSEEPGGNRRQSSGDIVAGHFHLVRLASQALTKVRQRVTRQVLGRRGTTRACSS
jgi:Transposase